MLGRRTWGVVAAVAAAGALATPAAALDTSLVPTRADVPGFAASARGASVGRSALGGQVPAVLRRAPAQGAAFRNGSGRLSFGAFELSTPARAAAALRAAGRGGRTVRIGDAARLRVRVGRRSTDAVVVLRVRSAVGAVRLRLGGRVPAAASATVRAYAASLADRLRRGLALTAWDRTIGRTRSDGSITPQIALQAFSLVYGPLPGVKRPAGPSAVPITAGTHALRLVARMWGRLSQAQRNAIDRKVGRPHDPSSPRIARRAEKLTKSPALAAKVNGFIAQYRKKIPGIPPIKIEVFRTDTPIAPEPGKRAAWSAPMPPRSMRRASGGGGVYDRCLIRVTPFGQSVQGTKLGDYMLAHEAFHCVQYKFTADWPSVADWIMEGVADWAAVSITKVSIYDDGWFLYYLDHGSGPLFARAYDALGFWGHLDEVSGPGSLWAKLPFIHLTDSVNAFLLAGGGDLTSIETWAPAMFRFPGAGSAWYLKHPYAISYGSFKLPFVVITKDASLTTPAYSTKHYGVYPAGKRNLVRIDRSEGFLRAGDANHDYGAVDSSWFCFGTCKCPKDQESSIPDNTVVKGGRLSLGFGASGQGGSGSITYRDPKEFCHKRKPPPGPGESNGDPHLTSLDGLHYDFQAAGEFVLVRSRAGDLEIQARQETYGKSSSVTVNTQLAFKVAGHRVTVGPGATADSVPVVRIDGTPNALPPDNPVPLGGGIVSREPADPDGNVDVTWPDGSEVLVRPVGKWGVAARIDLATDRAGAVNGLLGDFDGNPRDDLADRRGRRIPYTAKATSGWGAVDRYRITEEFERRFFDNLYDKVGDAWRISQTESLLDYAKGQSTKTFTDRSIPTRPVDPEAVARAKRAAAERICRARGVTLPGPLADCITDVAATGNAAFADDALAAQESTFAAFTRLRAGADRRSIPNLLTTSDGTLHIAFEERLAGPVYRMVDVPVDPAGREAASEVIEGVDGEPALLTGPDGGVQAVAAEIRFPATPPSASGIFRYARAGNGAWAFQGPVTTQGTSYSRPAQRAVRGGRHAADRLADGRCRPDLPRHRRPEPRDLADRHLGPGVLRHLRPARP